MDTHSRGDGGNHPAKRAGAFEEPVTHLFQVQLHGAELDPDQVERVAESIRSAARDELLAFDFRIEALTPLFERRAQTSGCSGCGGACHGH
jgi:hypothetical protein